MGYYGGKGGRLVATSTGSSPSVTLLRNPSPQPAPITSTGPTGTGLIDAGNWSVSATWAVPSTAVSGVYIAHLIAGAAENHIPFVVRDDAGAHDIVFQTSDTTWHAYNGWHGNSLYGGGGPGSDGRAYKVSYNRPIPTRDGTGTYAGPQDFLFGEEIAAIHWLEANGYDVCYMAGVDTDRLDPTGAGKQFANRKVFISCGHDEYWSGNQRKNVEAARANGKHLCFWSGNEVFWKTRWEADGNGTPYRTLVCYKETRDFANNPRLDPLDPGTVTCTWRDNRYGPNANQPENALTGTIFQVDDFREDQILIPFPKTKLRFWRNCAAITSVTAGGSGKLVKNYLGYEWDEAPDNGFCPQGLIRLSSTTLSVDTYIKDQGVTEGTAIATHSLTLYKHPSGAIVFGAGTVMWAWGLDPNHDPDPRDSLQTPVDNNVKQAMINLLGDMGISAGSLVSPFMPGLPSTDHTAPTAAISSPASGASLPQNQNVTVTGTCSDVGGLVAGIEISTDGSTWHPASTTSFNSSSGSLTGWTYNWSPLATGSNTIRARAIDDSLNIGAAASVTVTVTASSSLSFFSGVTPGNVSVSDSNSVELGLKFSSTQAGTISAIRFYKGPLNTGTHTAHLWTATGTLLASANFTGESSSGWQQANFAAPVAISAGVSYVASYHTPGNYSADDNYFSAARTVGPLSAPVGNGLYTYGANPALPASTFSGSNYYVDVVFNPGAGGGPQPPVANNDSGIVVTENTLAFPIQAATLLNNDTDPGGLAIVLNSVTNGTGGTVSLSGTTVTFKPTTNYTGPASFTYTIKNSAGLISAAASVSLTVNPPGTTTASLFTSGDTPAIVTVNDHGAVELGVKFTSSMAGKIIGIRFYKGPQNLGAHTAHLWSSAGALMGSANFSGETASGWQQANFATAVAIQANTVYVASYFAPQGSYSANGNYFANAHASASGILSAPASAGTGGNGVYAYSATSKFPNTAFNATNYWIDVVFTT